MQTIGFGGSCHWCTGAIFQSLKGVSKVAQGWIASEGDAAEFSEAVLVDFEPEVIPMATLVAVHLHTHSCTSNHSMRTKYRSAVYSSSDEQAMDLRQIIQKMQSEFNDQIITKVLPVKEFKLNKEEFLNYYYSNPEKPFCRNYITPKLNLILKIFQ